jgi:SAM-dependent methyltransferase
VEGAETDFYERQQVLTEASYLAGTDARQQSGFRRDERDWERFRRPVASAIDCDGTFLDIGCANGLLMESVASWAREGGRHVEPYGVDISEKLVELARRRLPHWRQRIFAGNAMFWEPPQRFDFVRTELIYVPDGVRRLYVERLLARHVAPGGRLIVCSYGSSRPEGQRCEPLEDEMSSWGLPVEQVTKYVSSEHGFVITKVVSVSGMAETREP